MSRLLRNIKTAFIMGIFSVIVIGGIIGFAGLNLYAIASIIYHINSSDPGPNWFAAGMWFIGTFLFDVVVVAIGATLDGKTLTI